MKCIECGHELKDGAIFCIRCGAMQVSMDGKPLEPKSAAGDAGSAGQHAVGMKPTVAGEPARGFNTEPERGGGRTAALIAAIVAAVALIAFLAVSCIGPALSGGNSGTDTAAQTGTSESAESDSDSASSASASSSASSASASSASASSASASASSASAEATPEIVNPQPAPEPEPQPQPQPEPQQNAAPAGGGSVLPDSSSRYYSRGELEGMSTYDLYFARNEIFARHGRMFQRSDLQDYFNSQSWYTPLYTPAQWESMGNQLSDVELKNVALMREVEAAKGSPYL